MKISTKLIPTKHSLQKSEKKKLKIKVYSIRVKIRLN